MVDKIDFVITWVDDSDEEWQKDRNSYLKNDDCDTRVQRFRNWDLLRYWFRGVEKFAPWVNRIHFITYGHLPKYLNVHHPKLNIVKHSDFIPSKFLPTFNSNAIELNIHRIEGLEEHFVYFNDDVFLINTVSENDFFDINLPCDAAVLGCVMPLQDDIYSIIFNNLKVINKYFYKNKWLKENFWKILNYKYGRYLIRTCLMLPFSEHTGFYDFHLALPFTKKTFLTIWEREPELLETTCSHKFRTAMDINIWLMRYWQLASGKFRPHEILGEYFEIGDERIDNFITTRKNKMICCNDVRENIDFFLNKDRLSKSFEQNLKSKSQFEL